VILGVLTSIAVVVGLIAAATVAVRAGDWGDESETRPKTWVYDPKLKRYVPPYHDTPADNTPADDTP
jgi:hypothetical protein